MTKGLPVLRETAHGRMMFLAHDSFIGRSLDIYGQWALPEITLLERVLLERPTYRRTVVDAGANVGTHTLSLAAMGGEVYAFEPQSNCYHMLAGNLALNGITNVVAMHCALGALGGRAAFPHLPPWAEVNHGGVRRCPTIDYEQQPIELIPLLTLDEVHLEAVDLMKVDVEGDELDVLQGAKLTIERCQPVLFVEANGRGPTRALLEQLDAWGYAAWWWIDGYYRPNNFRGFTPNVFEGYDPDASLLCLPSRRALPVVDEFPLVRVDGLDDTWKDARERGA